MRTLCIFALLIALGMPVVASETATQTVTFQVKPISCLVVTSSSAPVRASKGLEISDSSTTYAVTTNGDNRRIMAALKHPLPDGVSVSMQVTPPSGAKGLGFVALSSRPTEVVSRVSRVAEKGLPITYKLKSEKADFTIDPSELVLTIIDN